MSQTFDPARIQRFFSKYKFVALILCIGIVLMLLPVGGTASSEEEQPTPAQTAQTDFDLDALERKLEAALAEINGVGEVTVVLTLKSSGEEVLAQDVSQGNTTETETVIVSTGSSTEQAVSVKTIYPEFQGALVICDGAGSASVKLEVLQAVSAITGLSSDKISICRRK